jgi:hypothetical protein
MKRWILLFTADVHRMWPQYAFCAVYYKARSAARTVYPVSRERVQLEKGFNFSPFVSKYE